MGVPVGFDARSRVDRWILSSVALLRLAQYATPAPAVAAHITWDDSAQGVVVGGFLVGCAWSLWLFVGTLTSGATGIRPGMATLDVLVVCALQTVTPVVLGADHQAWQNWTYGPAIGAAFVALLYIPGGARWVLAALPIVS